MKLFHKEFGEGQPFVILHGLFGSSDNWQTHAKKIAEYYRVIIVDLRNHGHSPWSEDFSYPIMMEDVKELFDDLKLENVILMGHSMGGKVAMLFAQTYPKYLDKMIVVDMGVKEYPMHHDHILDGIKTLDLTQIKSRSEAEQLLSVYIESNGVKQFLLKNLYWIKKGQLAWRMNVRVLDEKMNIILGALEFKESFVPTLFIHGALSSYILEEDIPQIEQQFPDSEFRKIENAGHWVHSEAPEDFLETTLSFCLR